MEKKITKNLKTSVQDVNDAKGIVTIQITQFERFDSDNDRMLKGAFTKTWNDGSQVHLVDHNKGLATFVGLPVRKDPDSGIIESQLNLNKQIGKDVLADYQFGQLHGRSLQHSHGFMAVQGKYTKNEKGGRDFSEIKQFEYSTLLYGAVADTPLHGIKSATDAEELLEMLNLKLAWGNYTPEYCKLLEVKVAEIKSMILEPQLHSIEQKEPSENTQLTEFKNLLKI